MQTVRPPLSFVIIARNQASTIVTCVDSVLTAARAAGLPAFEIVYVDSDSSDGTWQRVRDRFGERVRIVRLTGLMNAAIARNVGARVSTGDALFFIDGDMEIDPGFLPGAMDAQHRLVHPLITGQLPEKFYDGGGRFIADGPDRYKVHARGLRSEVGGISLMTREAFESVGGYRPELRINEDLDLGLRLSRAGTQALALPHALAIHHTVEYFDWARLGRMLKDGSLFYPGAIFRRHWANPGYWPVLISHQRPTAVMVVSLLLALAVHPAWLLLYLSYVIVKNLRRPGTTFLQDLVGTTLRSSCFLVGIPFFYPPRIPADQIRFETVNAIASTAPAGGAVGVGPMAASGRAAAPVRPGAGG